MDLSVKGYLKPDFPPPGYIDLTSDDEEEYNEESGEEDNSDVVEIIDLSRSQDQDSFQRDWDEDDTSDDPRDNLPSEEFQEPPSPEECLMDQYLPERYQRRQPRLEPRPQSPPQTQTLHVQQEYLASEYPPVYFAQLPPQEPQQQFLNQEYHSQYYQHEEPEQTQHEYCAPEYPEDFYAHELQQQEVPEEDQSPTYSEPEYPQQHYYETHDTPPECHTDSPQESMSEEYVNYDYYVSSTEREVTYTFCKVHVNDIWRQCIPVRERFVYMSFR